MTPDTEARERLEGLCASAEATDRFVVPFVRTTDLRALLQTKPEGDLTKLDGRAICDALGFDPTNHHNALKCPYCNPLGLPLAEAKPEGDAPSHVLERERSAVAVALTTIRKAINAREHLREPGRGSFAYDDEGYQQEFGAALDEITAALEPLRVIAGDWSGCPTDPVEIAKARAPKPEGEAGVGGDLDQLLVDLRRVRSVHVEGDVYRKTVDEVLARLPALAQSNRRLREGLERIAAGETEEHDDELGPVIVNMDMDEAQEIARAALSEDAHGEVGSE